METARLFPSGHEEPDREPGASHPPLLTDGRHLHSVRLQARDGRVVDCEVHATMVDGPVLQSDPGMVKYAGKTLPLKVTGTATAPSVLPDFSAIVRQQVTEEVEDKVDEKVDEARDRVRDRLRGLLER